VHCAIGSAKLTNDEHDRTHVTGSGDYVVTSTLASQCPPAVGRALGFSMVEALRSCDDDDDDDDIDRNTTRPISFVTIGDGSVHNAHFLSAFNLARHARFRRKKCPVVFGVSDNGLSISYATDGYADYLFSQCSDQHSKGGSFNDVRIFKANGCDMMDVYDKTLQASSYSRKYSAPSLILYKELTRRFGHAATDRQHAYLDADEIASMAESDVVAIGIVQTVNWNAITYGEAHARFEEIGDMVSIQFLLVQTAHSMFLVLIGSCAFVRMILG
jgi:TPP-dependent pyruvate/acetoin dehydrogenase alpha subunit